MSESVQTWIVSFAAFIAALYLLRLWVWPKILAFLPRSRARLANAGCSGCPSSRGSCHWSKAE